MVSIKTEKPKRKLSFKQVSMAIGVDLLVFAIFIILMHPQVNEKDVYDIAVEHQLLCAIFIINVGFAVAANYVLRPFYRVLLINSIVGVLIFHFLIKAWFAFFAF